MKKIMGLVDANFSSSAFGGITDERPVASLPFGGRYRLIDFPLSNMVNSNITTVGLITPHMYRSLMDHVGVGKEWSLSRKVGGMFILPGSIYGLKNMYGKFLLRDVILNTPYFERGGCDLVAVTGCSKIYNIDYRKVAQYHEESNSEITLIYKKGLKTEAKGDFYLELSESNRVTGISSAPNADSNCFLDSFIIDRELLLNLAEWYKEMSYLDIMEIIIENLDKIRISAYEFDGYVGPVDDLASYMKSNRDLLSTDVREALFLKDRPISTKIQDSAPTKYMPTASVKNSFISSGCIIEGTVENSIIFRGVHIKKGAVVKNCVIMQRCTIGEGTVLENIVCDKLVRIKPDVSLLANESKPIAVGKNQEL